MKIKLNKIWMILLTIIMTFSFMSWISSRSQSKLPGPIVTDSLAVQKRVLSYLNQQKWNELFPHRYGIQSANSKNGLSDFYSFDAFLNAVKFFPEFLDVKDKVLQKRELAAFLANMAYETGGGWPDSPDGYFKWGLHFVEEQGCTKGCPQYTDTSKKDWMPVVDKSYHGRGPLQLSWNYNYGQFSQFFYGNKDSLLLHPEIVAENSLVSFASALWFWMHAQKPKPSCHAIMAGSWKPNGYDSVRNILPGFGAVVNIINGGIECGTGKPDGTYSRVGYYQYFCNYFKVSTGTDSSCMEQKPFNSIN
ncbi:chitinase [Hydrotalea sp. AMD]|uniref:chitinase n=1 Tax=Hydrotalea sp. AMD TaxID=2501297 RepID=UPI00257D91EF|nr:chitinase [Hydrotalea sp. AMD]